MLILFLRVHGEDYKIRSKGLEIGKYSEENKIITMN